jgi:hypothetical protein
LYVAAENELQEPGMTISKKYEQGPKSHLFRKNRLPSDFNVEVEGADVEVINILAIKFKILSSSFLWCLLKLSTC